MPVRADLPDPPLRPLVISPVYREVTADARHGAHDHSHLYLLSGQSVRPVGWKVPGPRSVGIDPIEETTIGIPPAL